MTLTVVKKGQEIEFDSQFDTLNAAKGYLAQFMAYNSFAMDLLSKRKLSEKQEAWVHYLATEHKTEAEAPVVEGEFISLVNKMYAGVKTPTRKFHLHLPSGVSISTITKGVNQGGLYVFENSNYVAKITDKGVLKGDVSEDVRLILEDACDNLLKLAQLYGHESGNCAVCHRPLTDPKSIALGIGPICLKRLSV
jgi:hypothetical protein